jgi:hypothetical protein
MKTIAAATVLMMFVAPTWASEAESNQANDPANSNEPIVLSEAEMDGVTAGYRNSHSGSAPLPSSGLFVTIYNYDRQTGG